MTSHRVVITGLGCVTPIGITATTSFQNLLSGLNGIRNILSLPEWQHLHREIKSLSSHLAAPVLALPPKVSSLSERTKFPRSFLFAEMAAKEALNDSNLGNHDNLGVFFGCGMPGVTEIYENSPLISDSVTHPKIIIKLQIIIIHLFREKFHLILFQRFLATRQQDTFQGLSVSKAQ